MIRKLTTHASEEIRFYLCQRKFIDNIDPHVLYNTETIQYLWEVLWECLEGQNTNDLTLLERLTYRSKIIMWNWREIVDEAEDRGEGVEVSAEELASQRKRGSLDHNAHDEARPERRTSQAWRVKLKKAKKHRKMFPGFYRGELLAPSAPSIRRHNELIRKLLGKEQAKSVMQTRKHNGTEIQKTLFDNSSDSEDRTSSDTDESLFDDDDDDEGVGKWTSRRIRRKASSSLMQVVNLPNNSRSLHGSSSSDSRDGENSSSDDDEEENDAFDENSVRQDRRSTFGMKEEKKKSWSGIMRRRSVVARNLSGLGKALIGL